MTLDEQVVHWRALHAPVTLVVREVVDWVVPDKWVIEPHRGAKPGWVQLTRIDSAGKYLRHVEFTPDQAVQVAEALIACAAEQRAVKEQADKKRAEAEKAALEEEARREEARLEAARAKRRAAKEARR